MKQLKVCLPCMFIIPVHQKTHLASTQHPSPKIFLFSCITYFTLAYAVTFHTHASVILCWDRRKLIRLSRNAILFSSSSTFCCQLRNVKSPSFIWSKWGKDSRWWSEDCCITHLFLQLTNEEIEHDPAREWFLFIFFNERCNIWISRG